MRDKAIDSKRLGWNIRRLMEFYGETQNLSQKDKGGELHKGKKVKIPKDDSFADKVGAGSSGTISGWLSGGRTPTRDNLGKIAKHFRVSEYDLLYRNYNTLALGSAEKVFQSLNIDDFDILFPLVKSDNAMKSQMFVRGYSSHRHLQEDIKNGKTITEERLDRVFDYYHKAYSNDKVPEAVANILCMLMWDGMMTAIHSPRMVKQINELRYGRISVGDFVRKGLLWDHYDDDDDEMIAFESQRKAYLKAVEPAHYRLIEILKQTADYADLAYYYAALRYSLGLVDNALPPEVNCFVGQEMLAMLDQMGNQYVSRLGKMLSDLVENK